MSVQIKSEAEAASLALALIGAKEIGTLDGRTPEAARLRLLFGSTLEDLLTRAPWDFAITRKTLVQGEVPEFGFSYSYLLPIDCANPVEFNSFLIQGTEQKTFVIEGRSILTNEEEGRLRYVSFNSDVAAWPAEFVTAFSFLLAANLAPALTKNPNLAGQLLGVAENTKIPKAIRQNANRQRPPIMDRARESSLVAARYF